MLSVSHLLGSKRLSLAWSSLLIWRSILLERHEVEEYLRLDHDLANSVRIFEIFLSIWQTVCLKPWIGSEISSIIFYQKVLKSDPWPWSIVTILQDSRVNSIMLWMEQKWHGMLPKKALLTIWAKLEEKLLKWQIMRWGKCLIPMQKEPDSL